MASRQSPEFSDMSARTRGAGCGETTCVILSRYRCLAIVARRRPSATPARPQRIISLIPAVTEMLFAVGAGPQVVAVSSFDEYPPEVKNLQRVGALLDPDLERILSLRPDLVVVYGSQEDLTAAARRAPASRFTPTATPGWPT